MLPADMRADAQVEIVRDKIPARLKAPQLRAPGVEVSEDEFLLRISQTDGFYVSGGRIVVDVLHEHLTAETCMYILGSCVGAALYQRRILPLHGSCVTKHGAAVLIMGQSGAGKSTLAAEFLQRGWQLMADDISAVTLDRGEYAVSPGYPSQKLWKDGIERFANSDSKIRYLYSENGRDKYALDVRERFCTQARRPTLAISLFPSKENVVKSLHGLEKIEAFMNNSYRGWMLCTPAQRKWHLEVCAALAGQMPVFKIGRRAFKNESKLICEEIERLI